MQGNKGNDFFNHEGYPDLTAFKALKNIFFKGDHTMDGWNDGDVVKLRLMDGRDVYRILLKVHDRYATTLNLYEEESNENEFAITVDGKKMHADLGKIAFTKARDMANAEFMFSMGRESHGKLMKKIGRVIGVPAEGEEAELLGELDKVKKEAAAESKKSAALEYECAQLREKNKALEDQNDDAVKKLSEMPDVKAVSISYEKTISEYRGKLEEATQKLSESAREASEAKETAIRAEAERDVYKTLYSQVMTKHGM